MNLEQKNPHANAGALVSVGADTNASSSNPARKARLSAFENTNHIIELRRVGGVFEVRIEPDHPAHPPQCYPTYKLARGNAGGLRLVHRWQIADYTEEGAI